jgi:glycerol uptake facilitator-like aquaporin
MGWPSGFTVLAGTVAVGGISSAAFNPAVTFAGAVMHTGLSVVSPQAISGQFIAGQSGSFASGRQCRADSVG